MDVLPDAELRMRVDALAARVVELERAVHRAMAALQAARDASVIVYSDPHAQADRADASRDTGARR